MASSTLRIRMPPGIAPACSCRTAALLSVPSSCLVGVCLSAAIESPDEGLITVCTTRRVAASASFDSSRASSPSSHASHDPFFRPSHCSQQRVRRCTHLSQGSPHRCYPGAAICFRALLSLIHVICCSTTAPLACPTAKSASQPEI